MNQKELTKTFMMIANCKNPFGCDVFHKIIQRFKGLSRIQPFSVCPLQKKTFVREICITFKKLKFTMIQIVQNVSNFLRQNIYFLVFSNVFSGWGERVKFTEWLSHKIWNWIQRPAKWWVAENCFGKTLFTPTRTNQLPSETKHL